ncbi:hypothetical protein E3N88_28059 [Mikania micrantha]|uniref:Uncharacterized protein n=1 Tax=Mikania micrantha TaxID=192012 RepID=A0A5N6MYK9_9ASTR|nr:hypothetical protein E3N88_28059 [Mikania micrantha]
MRRFATPNRSLPEELVQQIAHCKHAKDIWDAIKIGHLGVERVIEARQQTLKAEFEAARMKDNKKIDDFATKLAGISSKSAALGTTVIEETTLVRKLLIAIPERFLYIAATIEELVDLKTVKFQEVICKLKAYEERIGARSSNNSKDKLLLAHDEYDQKRRQDKSYSRGRGSGQNIEEGAKIVGDQEVVKEEQDEGKDLMKEAIRLTKPRKIDQSFSVSGVMPIGISLRIAHQGKTKNMQTFAKLMLTALLS